jgi:LmbE family N-acetylglucosaminyl deacetylase
MRLGIPDGQVLAHRNKLRNFLASVVECDVTLVAPYERDGHPDHDAVGAVCMELARVEDIPLARYPVWRWHYGDPGPLLDARWGRFPLSTEAQRAKAQALREFGSQLQPTEGESTAGEATLPGGARLGSYFERPYEAFML